MFNISKLLIKHANNVSDIMVKNMFCYACHS